MEVLFLGLSVTEQRDSYVQFLGELTHNIKFNSVAVGGIHPNVASVLFFREISSSTADIVVIEWSTSAFRNWFSRKQYIHALLLAIGHIVRFGKVPVILDLPRLDVCPSED
ncbi:hypothetical protein [Thalassotalea euphylliae]|uniref:Uncharacterized protein n=1 Tax=Thalassotalea euphylliae TaxID=1655234 RepID=A0A3E0TZS4_9GAMM|nr:hypothetical protein [Thalassotalea euphylliae]REL30191.1 hypothetical protein DXX94_05445 [Thalassotalea euphylliae]